MFAPPGRFFLPCRQKNTAVKKTRVMPSTAILRQYICLGIADFWHTKQVASKSEILPLWSNSVNMTPITCFRSKNRYISVWRLSGLVLASGGTLRFKNTKKIVCCKKQKKHFKMSWKWGGRFPRRSSCDRCLTVGRNRFEHKKRSSNFLSFDFICLFY